MAQPTLIGSVQRALRLLEVVAASEETLSAKKLARMTGLQPGTAYHLLRTLAYEGYLRKIGHGYVLGPAARLTDVSPLQALLPRIRPVLRSLRDEIGGATYFSIFDEGEIRLVDIADGPGAPCVDLWVGVHESGHASAFGKCILAGLSRDSLDHYINRHDLHDLTPNTITNRRVLEQSLANCTDIWSDDQEYLLGVSCTAASVQVGKTAGAVAVSLPSQRSINSNQSIALRRAARRLSTLMDARAITI